MNKHDLIKAIAATSGLRAVDILKAMGAFENILVDCMARGERGEALLVWHRVFLRAGT